MMKAQFLGLLLLGISPIAASADPCRENLARSVCIVTFKPEWHCARDLEARYYPKFQVVYDQLPPKLQAALCSYKEIEIQDFPNGGVSAFSWFLFRARLVEKDLPLEHWATWKDQLNFGVPNDNNFSTRGDLPIVRTNLPAEYRGLYFLVLHEFGHNLKKNQIGYDRWKAIDARPENSFPNKSKLCTYDCQGKSTVSSEEIPALYRDLIDGSLYLSLYGAMGGPGEDIPDTFAYWMVNQQHPEAEYWLDLPNGDRYEVMSKLKSERFREKRELVKNWYEQSFFHSDVMRISFPPME